MKATTILPNGERVTYKVLGYEVYKPHPNAKPVRRQLIPAADLARLKEARERETGPLPPKVYWTR